jgi:hypothetical protein
MLTMGSQTATQTTVSTPGTTVGNDGLHTGQGFIYYVLAATNSGSQTATFHASGGASQTQLAYLDIGHSAGCGFHHHVDSAVGTGIGGGTANTPSISGVSGDVLVNFVVNTQHVNPSVNSPWSCPTYSGGGETQTCQIVTTENGVAYILSGAAGSTATNWTLINKVLALWLEGPPYRRSRQHYGYIPRCVRQPLPRLRFVGWTARSVETAYPRRHVFYCLWNRPRAGVRGRFHRRRREGCGSATSICCRT